MTWSATTPYNDLPLLPPREDVESRAVLRDAIRARAALASLNQASKRMPNPLVLVNTISLLEAQASSEIENIVTTTDELFRFAQASSYATNSATKETLRYREALFAGHDAIARRPLTVNTAREICERIHGRQIDVRTLPGTIIGNEATREAIYTPPSGERILREKLANWAEYLHRDDEVDPLVKMAIAHYQFEAIHPFEDGNGRTGRILNILFLVGVDLLHAPILYLSRYFISHKSEYYRLLLAVTRDGAWAEWIRFVLEGIEVTATQTIAKIDDAASLQESVRAHLREHTTAGSNGDLLDLLFEKPYARISDVIERCDVSRPTATAWLDALVASGSLETVKAGRERLFINSRFINILATDRPRT